jgi:hypothetical protein
VFLCVCGLLESKCTSTTLRVSTADVREGSGSDLSIRGNIVLNTLSARSTSTLELDLYQFFFVKPVGPLA